MRLKDFRKDNRLSQSIISDLFECTQGHVSLIESGVRNITTLQLRLLIEKFGVESISPYLEDSDRMPASININAPKISGNTAPVNAGECATQNISTDDKLLELLKKKDEQIDRLISLLESKYNQ